MKLKNTESLASMDIKQLHTELVKAHDEMSEVMLGIRMRNEKDVNKAGKLKKRIAIIQTHMSSLRKQSAVITK